jgi:DNA-binding FadR family transcriptional regulator
MATNRLRVPKAAEVLAGKLRDDIIRGVLKEGEDLPPEAALLEQFGTSRQSLREAFRILESEGLLSLQRGSRTGARVHAPTAAGASRYFGILLRAERAPLRDVFWTEGVVEGLAGELIAASGKRDAVRRLRANVKANRKVIDDAVRGQELLVEFHELVIQLIPVKSLQLLCMMLREIVDDAVSTYSVDPPFRADPQALRAHSLDGHEQFVEMVATKDAAAAGKFWREHLAETFAALQDRIETSATARNLPLK